jgi:hypothetical protein
MIKLNNTEIDFYYTIKRIYEQKTDKHWSKDDFSTQPTEEYMEWLENELRKSWNNQKPIVIERDFNLGGIE